MATLNLGQRIVAVVALAAALCTVWVYLVCPPVICDGGWFGYAPLSGESQGVTISQALVDSSGSGLVALLLALGFIAVWACASIWLFGLSYPGPTDGSSGPASD